MSTKQLLGGFYHRFAPSILQRALRPLLHPRLSLIYLQVFVSAPTVVLSGPFKGMKYPSRRLSLPIALGTYEIELHEVFHRLRAKHFSRIIDIGAAEGYYAVGSALWQPRCHVIAFEMNPVYHPSIQAIASANGVESRIEVRGACGISDLQKLGDDLTGAFLIVDVEGFEKELLDPDKVPQLRQSTILVERHDMFVPGCTEAIVQRFESSHTISSFQSRPRKLEEYPLRSRFTRMPLMRSTIIDSISDGRSADNNWMLLEPKS